MSSTSDSKVLFTVAEDKKLVEIISKLPCLYDVSSPLYKDLNLKDNAWREAAEFVDRSVEDVKKRWKNIKDTYHKRQKKKIEKAGHRRGKGKKWLLAHMLTFLNKVDYKRDCASNVEGNHSNEEIHEVVTAEIPQKPSTLHTPLENLVDRPPSKKAHTPENGYEAKTAEILQNMSTSYTPSQNVEDRPPRKKARPSNRVVDLFESQRMEREVPLKILAGEKLDDDVDLFFKSIACSVKKLRRDLINEAKMRSLQMVIEMENRNEHDFIDLATGSSTPSTDCD